MRAGDHAGRHAGRRRSSPAGAASSPKASGCWRRCAPSARRCSTPIQPMPFPAMQQALDGAFPDGTYNYWKASFVPELTDAVIDMMVEHGNRMPSPLSATGGRILRRRAGAGRAPAESAFAQRGAEYNIGMTAQWTDPAETAQAHRLGAAILRRDRAHSRRQPSLELPERGERRGGRAPAFGDNYRPARRGEAQVRSREFLQPQPEHPRRLRRGRPARHAALARRASRRHAFRTRERALGRKIRMSKRDDLIAIYASDLQEKCGVTPDMALLTKVAIGLGPAIYNSDTSPWPAARRPSSRRSARIPDRRSSACPTARS